MQKKGITMDIYGILSLIFCILGILSSYWYIGIVPCAIGLVLGIVGMIDSYMDSKTSLIGALLSVFGAIATIFFIVSDIDSDKLVISKFGGEKIETAKNDDFMRFHKEEGEAKQEEDIEIPVRDMKEEKQTPYQTNDGDETVYESREDGKENEAVSVQTEEPKENNVKENKSVYHTGEIANCNGLELTFLGYTESSGTEYNSPADGKVFVFPEFEVYNGTGEKVTMDTRTPFLYYCDGYNVESSSSAIFSMSELDLDVLTGDIVQGGRMKACLPLELPSDWKEMEIYYKDNYYGDTKFSFVFGR